jgi:hypothetical protein
MSIIIDAIFNPSVNFAMCHNGIPIISGLKITNDTDKTIINAQIRIHSNPSFLHDEIILFDRILPGEISECALESKSQHNIRLNAEFLMNLTEKVSGNIILDLMSNEEILATKIQSMEVLSFDEWPGLDPEPLISAFVTPNNPAINPILSKVSEILRQRGISCSLDGYASEDRSRVKNMVGSIYAALQQLDIVYVTPPASFETKGQRIRMAETVLNEKIGTCIDLTLLFASIMEAIGLNPIIIFRDKHAFVGVWLEKDTFPDVVIYDSGQITRRAGDDVICLIECTSVVSGQNVGFNRSCEIAFNSVDDTFNCAVDVKKSRSIIHPIPTSAEERETVERQLADSDTWFDASVKKRAPANSGVKKNETIIEKWERKLLDTTSRNNLISIKNTKKAIPLMGSDVKIFMKLCESNKGFTLNSRPMQWSGIAQYESTPFEPKKYISNYESVIQDEMKNNILRTPLSDKDKDTRLISLYREARRNIEESGSSLLYFAVGMLKWYDKDSTIPRYAPLVLIPAEIERTVNSYRIFPTDEGYVFNETLIEKLRSEYEIDISLAAKYVLSDKFDIDVLLSFVRQSIDTKKRWDVVSSTVLGVFLFNQFVMWDDLRSSSNIMARNKLVRSLIEAELTWHPDEINDIQNPDDILLTVPADGSQIRAIRAMKEGKTFILRGPPGTGKSQTITNMISDALYNGKTVLFVAEKMAALEVVEERLNNIGIGDHCLELHSNKAQKSALLKKIQNTYGSINDVDQAPDKSVYEKLKLRREQLSKYASDLHRIQPSGISVYDAISMYSKYCDDAYDVAISSVLIDNRSIEKIIDAELIVNKLIDGANRVNLSDDNPLRYVKLSRSKINIKEDAELSLVHLHDATVDVKEIQDRVDAFGIKTYLGETFIRDVIQNLDSGYGIEIPNEDCTDSIHTLYNFIKESTRLMEELKTSNGADVVRVTKSSSFTNVVNSVNIVNEALLSSCGLIDVQSIIIRLNVIKTIFDLISKFHSELGIVEKSWNKAVLKLDGLSKIWSDANNAGFFSKGKKKKEFMSIVSGYLINPNLKFEMIPLVPINDALSTIDKLKEVSEQGLENHVENKYLLDTLSALDIKLRSNRNLITKYNLNYSDLLDQYKKIEAARGLLQELKTKKDMHSGAIDTVSTLLTIDPNVFTKQPYEHCIDLCNELEGCIHNLVNWIYWNNQCELARKENLGTIVESILKGNELDNLWGSFLSSYFKAVAEKGINESDSLIFSRRSFNATIREFKEFDHELMEINKTILLNKIRQTAAWIISNSQGAEYRELNRLMGRSNIRRTIRKLFEVLPSLLPVLFPCMMMSPLSASQYLTLDSGKFDYVIFDEASQVPTQKAVGALARGNNAVIAGDPNQLPPTTFFETKSQEYDEESDMEEDTESLIDECLSLGLPETYLEWHYRSRHESLIAFSNKTYYGNKMLTFPSSNDIETRVRLELVADGVYDRGRTRKNKAEATKIVDEVIERLRKQPNQSIGIVAFSSAQQECIQDELDQRIGNLYRAAYGESKKEPLFIKNLETVQGDERDVILFSIGYGPDKSGKISSNFGPLNKSGGHRRLNVAISRAREEMIVFTSMDPSRIGLRADSPEGVRNLKEFMDFAANHGRLPSKSRMKGDVGLATSIANEIEGLGYKTQERVGNSRFYVDIAVIDPNNQSRYILGILCDGETYKNVSNDKDREFARISILEGLKWNIMRISAVDWFSDRTGLIVTIHDRLQRLEKESIDDDKSDSANTLNERFISAPDAIVHSPVDTIRKAVPVYHSKKISDYVKDGRTCAICNRGDDVKQFCTTKDDYSVCVNCVDSGVGISHDRVENFSLSYLKTQMDKNLGSKMQYDEEECEMLDNVTHFDEETIENINEKAYVCTICGSDAGYVPFRTDDKKAICVKCMRRAGYANTSIQTRIKKQEPSRDDGPQSSNAVCTICGKLLDDCRQTTRDNQSICITCIHNADIEPNMIVNYDVSSISSIIRVNTENKKPKYCGVCQKYAGVEYNSSRDNQSICFKCAQRVNIDPESIKDYSKSDIIKRLNSCALCGQDASQKYKTTRDNYRICTDCIKNKIGIELNQLKEYNMNNINIFVSKKKVDVDDVNISNEEKSSSKNKTSSTNQTFENNNHIRTMEECYCFACRNKYSSGKFCATSDNQLICTKCVDETGMEYSTIIKLSFSDFVHRAKAIKNGNNSIPKEFLNCFIETIELKQRSDSGDSDAQFLLGDLYENGTDVKKDIVEAVRLYKLSAEHGNTDALSRLRVFAYERNNADAACCLGEIYNCAGSFQNREEANALFKLAASLGSLRAQQYLDSITEKKLPKNVPAIFGTPGNIWDEQ